MKDNNQAKGKPRGQLEYSADVLLLLAEQYIHECRCGGGPSKASGDGASDGGESYKTGKRDNERFPNIAGFCRYLGIGHRRYSELSESYPEETGQISAAFEDEALNSEKPAALISAYLKSRLGYAQAKPEPKTKENEGLTVVFSHDILSDGE